MHSFFELKYCFHCNVHFALHISLHRANAGVEMIGALASVIPAAKMTINATVFMLPSPNYTAEIACANCEWCNSFFFDSALARYTPPRNDRTYIIANSVFFRSVTSMLPG